MILNIKNIVNFIYKAFVLMAIASKANSETLDVKTETFDDPMGCISLTPEFSIRGTYNTSYAEILADSMKDRSIVNTIKEKLIVSFSQNKKKGSAIVALDDDKNENTPPKKFFCIYGFYNLKKPEIEGGKAKKEYQKEFIQILNTQQEASHPIIFSQNSTLPTYVCTSGGVEFNEIPPGEIEKHLCERGYANKAQCAKDGFWAPPTPTTTPTSTATSTATPTIAPRPIPTPFVRNEL